MTAAVHRHHQQRLEVSRIAGAEPAAAEPQPDTGSVAA
jgi:hypothetical protein